MKRRFLKEDPDTVFLDGEEIVRHTKGPNIAFIIYKDNNGKHFIDYMDGKGMVMDDDRASHSRLRDKIREKNPNYSYQRDVVRGRIWPLKKVASTYEYSENVYPYADLIEDLFKILQLDINSFGWDFGSSYGKKKFDSWNPDKNFKKVSEIPPSVKKEMDELIYALHTANPLEKSKIRNRIDQLQRSVGIDNTELDNYINLSQEKLNKSMSGYNSKAAADFYKGSIAEVEFEDDENEREPVWGEIPNPTPLNSVKDIRGYWISPDGNLYDVDDDGGHIPFATRYIFKINSLKDWQDKVRSGEIRHKDIRIDAVNLGWVRIRLHFAYIYRVKGHKHILEVQANKINEKQKRIISDILKSKDAIAMSFKEFEKIETEMLKRRVMRTKFR